MQHLIPQGADYAAAGNTSRCVPQKVATENRTPDAPSSAMNHSRRLRAPADGTSLRCATGFRNLRLHSRDMYGTSRFQKSDIPGATLCAPDKVHYELPSQHP